MPIDLNIEFFLQSDQTSPLSDIAERSDEVGIEPQYYLLRLPKKGCSNNTEFFQRCRIF
jgi:hypothetical protein